MESQYDLDIVIERASPHAPHHQYQHSYKFYIKIYKNGNVDIKEQCIDSHNGAFHKIRDKLVINDGISFPPCVISMLKYLFDNSVGSVPNMKCLTTCQNIIGSIKILQEELVKAAKLKGLPRAEQWLQDRLVQKLSLPLQTLFVDKDKRIDELEKLVEQIRGELGKEKKTICQLLSDEHAARLGADKKIADLVKSQDKEIDKLERIVTQKHRESASQSKRIDELERIVKIIRELEKDPTDAELDIRAKEGAKKHAEAKARLQKMYDERPMINLMDGESIGDLLVCM
jgi:hypothetical protein